MEKPKFNIVSFSGGKDSTASLTYTGSAITPANVTHSDDWAGGALTITYSNNTNVGTATASISVGNVTASTTFSITQKDLTPQPLPSGETLKSHATITASSVDGVADLYSSDITITPNTGWSVGLTPTDFGSVATISEETDSDGETITLYLKSPDGTIYETQFFYKLDKSDPTVDLTDINVGTGSTILNNQIIGNKDTIIKIPASGITDSGSAIAEVSYTATPESGAAKTGTLTLNNGNYEIALNEIATGGEFVGTIELTVKDGAGHTKQVTLPSDGGKVIVEEHSPVVEQKTLSTDPSIQPNENGWYNKNFDITVTVTDEKDNSGAAITSGGIAKLQWKDGENGEVHTVTVPTESGIVGTKEFTIPTSDGEHTYYVRAIDNAGNEGEWQEYAAVKVDTQKPAFTGNLTVTNQTAEGANISFTPTEGGKAYWIISDTQPTAEQVKQTGSVVNITSGTAGSFAITGLTGEANTVYVVLEDAAGNLSEVVKTEISNSDDTSDSDDTSNPDETNNPEETNKPGETSNPEETSKPEEISNPDDPDVIGNKSKEVKTDENVPKTKVTTLLNDLIEAVIPEEELAKISDSDTVKIVLRVEDAEETVTNEDRQAVSKALEQMGDFKLAQHLDVSLFQVINDNESKVTSTIKPIAVTFEIPEALRGSGREFAVIRVHENETTVLNDLDDDPNTVTIETDSFSTYALAYTDKPQKNPATGIAISLIPLPLALAALTVAAIKRKKK